MVESPGTLSGMALRVSQCVFATACIIAIIVLDFSDLDFWFYACLLCLKSMMDLQLLWSFVLACLDIHAMRNKEDTHQRVCVIFLAVVDGIMAILTFTAASAGALTLYMGDVDFCKRVACCQIVFSIVLGFITSLLAATSFIFMLRLQASLP